MKTIIFFIICLGVIVYAGLSFADDKQQASIHVSSGERAQEKATFNHSQRIYNDKENKKIRAKNMVAKSKKSNDLNNKRVEDEEDQKNEPYKKQVILKF